MTQHSLPETRALKEEENTNTFIDDEMGCIFSLDICVCVGVIVNGVVSWTKCPESLL